jgi:hypothetical protein
MVSPCLGQNYFEGEIKYKVTVLTKSKNIDPNLISEYDNKIWTYYFKDGNFKWNLPSEFWLSHIYNRKANKFYFIAKDSDLITWQNGKKITDSIIDIKTLKTKTKILNYTCNLLIIKTKYLQNKTVRTRSYYYSNELEVNSNWYVNYKNNNFDQIYKLTKSIPLKIIDDYGTFTIIYEAIDVKQRLLDISIFDISPKFRFEEL